MDQFLNNSYSINDDINLDYYHDYFKNPIDNFFSDSHELSYPFENDYAPASIPTIDLEKFFDQEKCDINYEKDYMNLYRNPENPNDEKFYILEDNETEQYYNEIEIKLKPFYDNEDFDAIIQILEIEFPNFFTEKNLNFLYVIQKLKFFKLIKKGNVDETLNFYNEILLTLLKEIKPNLWENKHCFFMKIIKNPNYLINNDSNYLIKYYEQFAYNLRISIFNYLNIENDNNNQSNEANNTINNSNVINKESEFISTSINNDQDFNDKNECEICTDIKQDKEKNKENNYNNEINEICTNNNNNCNNENNDVLSKMGSVITDISTKEEFSDFEDEIQMKKGNKNEKNYYFDNYSQTNNKEINPIFCGKNNNKKNKNKEKKEKEKENKEKSQNNENCKSKNKKNNTLFNQLPLLNSFKPKYVKREILDKKIIRTFRDFVIKITKEKRFSYEEIHKDHYFYICLCNNQIMPPFNYYDEEMKMNICFNSLNSNYLLWFFNKEHIKELYDIFLKEEANNLLEGLYYYYGLLDDDRTKLKEYIFNLPNIFDISAVDNLSKNEIFNYDNIYRKPRERKNGRKINRERSREIDAATGQK